MRKNLIKPVILIQVLIIGLLLVNHFGTPPLPHQSVKSLEKDFYPDTKDSLLEYFYEPRPGIHSEVEPWSKTSVFYTINKDTLNDRYDYKFDKSPDTFRIITLGDSFTFGMLVSTKDNYSEKLEDKLNKSNPCGYEKYEVLNLGVPGYDLQQQVERYRKRGIKYNPDLIVWLLKSNDFQIIEQLRRPLLEKYTNEVEKIGINEVIDKYDFFIPEEFERHDENWEFTVISSNAAAEVTEKVGGKDELLDIQEGFLNEINKYYDGSILLISFPSGFKNNEEGLEIIKRFEEDRPNTYFLDGLADIYREGGALPDSHPNTKGHQMIAESIGEYITKSNPDICE